MSLFSATALQAAVIEVGDLNIINDPGNPSDGLRFLDMTYSDGLTLPAALITAQATYADARLATPSEWDDLLAAAGLFYNLNEYENSIFNASDAFTVGGTAVISDGTDYDSGELASTLGFTNQASHELHFWSDPDGLSGDSTTRDYMTLSSSSATISQDSFLPGSTDTVGWLLVSSSVSAVPEPSSVTLMSLAAAGRIGFSWRRRRRR